MYIVFFLSLFSFQLYAADSGVPIALPITPNDFMMQLREAEKSSESPSRDDFIYRPQSDGYSSGREPYLATLYPLMPIQKELHSVGASSYFQYFINLATSEKIPDKLEKKFVCIPPFEKLFQEDPDKLDAFVSRIRPMMICSSEVGRLVGAGILHAGADLSEGDTTNLLDCIINAEDVPFLERAFQAGLDPQKDDWSILLFQTCNLLDIAKVMVNYGAKIFDGEQDAIDCLCMSMFFIENECELLSFYLSKVSQDNIKESGSRWMESLAENSGRPPNNIVEFVSIFLESGCVCDKEVKEKICENVGKELKEKTELLFQMYENPGQNIKG